MYVIFIPRELLCFLGCVVHVHVHVHVHVYMYTVFLSFMYDIHACTYTCIVMYCDYSVFVQCIYMYMYMYVMHMCRKCYLCRSVCLC